MHATTIADDTRGSRFATRAGIAVVCAFLVATLFADPNVGHAQTEDGEGQWETTGSLSVERYDHTTTLLTNGRVLAASGREQPFVGDVSILDSAEVYRPQSGEWTTTGALNEGRWSHTATRLDDGRVLVAGGFARPFVPSSNAQPVTDSAEIYDPETGTWTPTGDLNVRRALHTATLLPDGTVLVAGGRTCDEPPPAACNFLHRTGTAEIFDPAAETWTEVGSLTHDPHTTSSALLADGTVLVPGGFVSSGIASTAEVYDPETRTWRLTGSLNQGRARQGAMLLHDGRVLVAAGFGGDDTAEVYDPGTGTWTMTGNVAESRRFNYRYQVLPDGKALIAGGQIPFQGLTRTAELYDPATGEWSYAAEMPQLHGSSSSLSRTDQAVLLGTPRSDQARSTACGPHCGKVLVAGNNPDGGASLYTPACPTRMPQQSQRPTCAPPGHAR